MGSGFDLGAGSGLTEQRHQRKYQRVLWHFLGRHQLACLPRQGRASTWAGACMALDAVSSAR